MKKYLYGPSWLLTKLMLAFMKKSHPHHPFHGLTLEQWYQATKGNMHIIGLNIVLGVYCPVMLTMSTYYFLAK